MYIVTPLLKTLKIIIILLSDQYSWKFCSNWNYYEDVFCAELITLKKYSQNGIYI